MSISRSPTSFAESVNSRKKRKKTKNGSRFSSSQFPLRHCRLSCRPRESDRVTEAPERTETTEDTEHAEKQRLDHAASEFMTVSKNLSNRVNDPFRGRRQIIKEKIISSIAPQTSMILSSMILSRSELRFL